MLFNHSRELAQDYAGTLADFDILSNFTVFIATNIRDVIITVPAFFSQAQRRTVLQLVVVVILSCNVVTFYFYSSAQLVGLNVLQLITDSAAGKSSV